YTAQSPPTKDLLPLLGALKHLACWHAARISVVTEHTTGWQKAASYLSAGLVAPAELDSCIDHREMWRGGLVIREKKYASELRFDGFSLRSPLHPTSGSSLLQAPFTTTDHSLNTEVFHYYAPVLDLVQLVIVSDLPSFIMSSTELELGLSGKSVKAKLLLEQLRSLRGKVGALFSLSCVITPIAQPAVSQLSSQRWRELLAMRPKSLPVPDVELKGENAHYFLLVQGSDDDTAACRVRVLHSDSQINGAAAMATASGLLREACLSSSGSNTLMLIKTSLCPGRREAANSSPLPVTDLMVILNLAREQYLKVIDSTFHRTTMYSESTVLDVQCIFSLFCFRFGLLGPGSSDSLFGLKDGLKNSPALLDAKELLKHFTSDGTPTGELQPLAINRGNNVFQLSPNLSPGKVTQMSFSKASSTHYHGIQFCLDNQRSMDRDQAFVRLQSRLIRYETQTTCSKEPCALPFALSPAPSPAVMSEPGSVPDGETLQNADVARLKRRSWETDIIGGFPHKRLAKSESSDSLCSQSSGSSGTHPAIRSLRRQPSRSQSTSATISTTSSSVARAASSVQIYVSVLLFFFCSQMLQEVVAKTLKHHGITAEHECFEACSKRLFDISKFYLKDLKTSRGLHDEMKKAVSSNVKQVIDWVLEKTAKK
uniref:MDM2 binding protein n=1 Tax=Sphaeramia orbicularis TaxID=375764 RepID=A0A672YAX4_9TELE